MYLQIVVFTEAESGQVSFRKFEEPEEAYEYALSIMVKERAREQKREEEQAKKLVL